MQNMRKMEHYMRLDQVQRLRRESFTLDVSMAHIIREAVDRWIDSRDMTIGKSETVRHDRSA